MQIPQHILVLIEKYQAGTATEEEKQILNDWYDSHHAAETVLPAGVEEPELKQRIHNRLLATLRDGQPEAPVRPLRWWRVAASVAAVVLFATLAYLLFLQPKPAGEMAKTEPAPPATQPLVVPGGNKAILTLADGSTVILDTAANGVIRQAGGRRVQKVKDGWLVYNGTAPTPGTGNAALYNTITTPRGGQYQVTLSDGTRVWLNAASSIRFPVAFTGAERRVEITGEAYFEVAKNKHMPFKVQARTMEVEVLGTHFNVNAYPDEERMKTTLLEGAVKVTAAGQPQPVQLRPGQQADVGEGGNITLEKHADTEAAVAWKNGYFQFHSADLQTVLRQLARWYDINIVYKAPVNLHFTGQLKRTEDAARLFEQLSLTGEVHFKTEGKSVIVSP